jgi:hypothetical protein
MTGSPPWPGRSTAEPLGAWAPRGDYSARIQRHALNFGAALTASVMLLALDGCGNSAQTVSAHLSSGGWSAEAQVLRIGSESPKTSALQAVTQCRQVGSSSDAQARTISALCADSATTVGGLKQMLSCNTGASATPACTLPALRSTAASLRDYNARSSQLAAQLRGKCRRFFTLGLDRNERLAAASLQLVGDLEAGGAAATIGRAHMAAWQVAEQSYATGVGVSPVQVRNMVESCRP